MANALYELGVELVVVVHCGGLDELAPVAVATVATVTKSGVQMGTIDPFTLGFSKCEISDLKGGTAVENADILRQVKKTKRRPQHMCTAPHHPSRTLSLAHTHSCRVCLYCVAQVLSGKLEGPVTDTVILNAGAGLYVAGSAGSVAEGCAMAKAAIAAGKPMEVLSKWAVTSKAAVPVS